MSRYNVYVTPAAWKEIKNLPGRMRQRVRKAVGALAENPRPAKSKALDLLTLLKRFLSDQCNPARRPRQQSFEAGFVAIGSLLTDDDRSHEPSTRQTPESVFMRKWAKELVQHVQRQVKSLYEMRDQPELYELFEASLDIGPGDRKSTREELGARFDLDREQVKYRLDKIKQSFLVTLRLEVRDQVGSDADIDEEIAELFTLLSLSLNRRGNSL